MDKKRSVLNISVSVISRILLLIASLFVRRLLIRHLGNDVNGLNSLYTDIISMLAVADLGIGSAIVYSMYKPILENDYLSVAALYNLYKKIYLIIGAVIFCLGILLLPFLPCFIKDYESVSVNVYLTFFLTLVSVVLSYVYSAKTSLIEAHKNNYITTIIRTIARLIKCVIQIVAILVWKSYIAFLTCMIIETLLIWLLTESVIRRDYGSIIQTNEHVNETTRQQISRNVKAMMMHKIGAVMVKTVDGIIISAFIGVVVLGKYSNYVMIAATMSGIITLVFSPLTSVVGHLCAKGDRTEDKQWFDHFYCINYILGFVFFLGYYAAIDYVVRMLFGSGLEISRSIIFIITLNQFMLYMRNTLLLFRNASGTFYYDRWKPIAEGFVNLVLSLLFVNIFPEEYKVVGVIVATIITTLAICNTVEPYVVFHHVFGISPKKFYVRNYVYTGIFVGCLFIMNALMQNYDNQFNGSLVNGFISVGLSIGALGILAVMDKMFRIEVVILLKKMTSYARKLIRGQSL